MHRQRLNLVPIGSEHRDFLYGLVTDGPLASTWAFQGGSVSPDAFDGWLWSDVLAQFVVINSTDEPLGLVRGYGADLLMGTAFVATIMDTRPAPRGAGIDVTATFVDYLFATFPLRKLYFETTEDTMAPFGSAVGSVLVEEARIREHTYRSGRYVDLFILSMTR